MKIYKLINVTNLLICTFTISLSIIIALVAIILQQPNLDEYPDLNKTTEIIESRGFKHETHFVTASTGYILQIIRIVNPYLLDTSKLKPIILHHGFQASSSMWLIAESGQLQADGTYWESELTTPNNDSIGNSIGFVLATKGFDVWLANYRGNIYSMNHTTLNVEDSKFWEFSIDEMTREDLPALIEYVKEQTQKPSIGYIGHSQGNIMMFGLLAIQPKYSDSIRPFIALSPVFYGGRIRGPARFLHPFTQLLLKIRPKNIGHLLYRKIGLPRFCTNPIFQKYICFYIYKFSVGATWSQMNFKRLPIFLDTFSLGSSTRNLVHILQKVNREEPTFFDFEDEETNEAHYGQVSPPEYPVDNINSTHIALIYTKNDWIIDLENVETLKKHLKVKLMDEFVVPEDDWGHNELILGKDVGQYVNRKVLSILYKY